MGVEAVVESSTFGRRPYEKCGFVWVRDVEVKLGRRWEGRPVQRFAWMVRPKKGAK